MVIDVLTEVWPGGGMGMSVEVILIDMQSDVVIDVTTIGVTVGMLEIIVVAAIVIA